MKKSSSSSQNQNHGYFPSPGAPNYRNKGLMSQKGWSSERIPKPGSNSSIRRHTMSGLTMTPFSGGRTMPSKWDEAERWICSPVSVSPAINDNNNNHNSRSSNSSHSQLVHQRRPKSISGPIVHSPVAYYYSNYSPTLPLHQGLVVRNLMVSSPFSTGVLAPVAVSVHHYDAGFGYDTCNDDDDGIQYSSSSPLLNGNGDEQIFSAPMCSEQPCDPSSSISQDENHDGRINEDMYMFSRCDKGTQMSASETENDAHSSLESSSSGASVIDQQDCQSSKLEVRDVQVDSQATVIRGSKRHAAKSAKMDSLLNKGLRENSTDAQSSSWHIEEPNSNISKLQREEAKIIAWESLQKAKAEAAIRKLEMKLEKKRSSSMDKILNKLRKAQMKAENMRSLAPVQNDHQVSNTCKLFSFPKYAQIWSPISCFSSHAQ